MQGADCGIPGGGGRLPPAPAANMTSICCCWNLWAVAISNWKSTKKYLDKKSTNLKTSRSQDFFA